MGASEPAPAEARCAQHPTILARGTCPRCGTFICGLCSGTAGDERCANCREREPKRVRAPWERRQELGYARAFGQTLIQVLLTPRKFFSTLELEGAGVEPAMFGFIVLVLRELSYALEVALGHVARDGSVSFGAALASEAKQRGSRVAGLLLSVFVFIWIIQLGVHVLAKAKLPSGALNRLVGYAFAIQILGLPVSWALFMFPEYVFSVFFMGAQLALIAVGLVYAGGVSPPRAFVSVFGPFVFLAGIFFVLFTSFALMRP